MRAYGHSHVCALLAWQESVRSILTCFAVPFISVIGVSGKKNAMQGAFLRHYHTFSDGFFVHINGSKLIAPGVHHLHRPDIRTRNCGSSKFCSYQYPLIVHFQPRHTGFKCQVLVLSSLKSMESKLLFLIRKLVFHNPV